MRALIGLTRLAIGFLAVGAAYADLRFTSFTPDLGPGDHRVHSLLLSGGEEFALRPFRIVPLEGGVPSRNAAAQVSDLAGRLDQQGRAMVSFSGGAGDLAGVTLLAVVGGANGQARQTAQLEVSQATVLPGASVSTAVVAAQLAATTGIVSVPAPAGFGSQEAAFSVASPSSGSIVGSLTVDVRGLLGGPFNSPLTDVTVNGLPASVFPSASGRGQFLLTNVELAVGQNVIAVRAALPSGAQQLIQVPVQSVPATSNNVVLDGGRAIAARGTFGYAVMDLETRTFQTFAPPPGMNRVDDVAVADGFVFLLDAASGGRLASVDVSGAMPVTLSGPFTVPVGPFAGVSAGGGRVVVSGGTGLLTVRSYSGSGVISSAVGSGDLGIGQPDVLVSADGSRAFVSTDFAGTFGGAGFGMTTIDLLAPPAAPVIRRRTGLVGSGFTAGFLAPANFPVAAALMGDQVVVGHGGGVSLLDRDGVLLGSVPLGFPGTHVASDGSTIVAVGTGRRLAFVSRAAGGVLTVDGTETAPGPGAFTGVAMDGDFIAIAAGAGGLRVLRR